MVPRQLPLAQLAEQCRLIEEKDASASSILAQIEEFEKDLKRDFHSTSFEQSEACAASDQADESAGSESSDNDNDSIVQRYFTGNCKIVGRTLRSRYTSL